MVVAGVVTASSNKYFSQNQFLVFCSQFSVSAAGGLLLAGVVAAAGPDEELAVS
jgi:hypothetical protein